jgi:hypothetical protein
MLTSLLLVGLKERVMKAKISKAKTIAIALAGSLALIWSGAVAAAGQRNVDGRTAAPASQSTPGLAGLSDDAVATGSTLGIGGSGTVGYDSTRGAGENVDYWRLGEEPSGSTSGPSDRNSGVIVHPEPNR